MKILIFYASYGGGHLSAASSIRQYIVDNYKEHEVEMIDCVKYINKNIDKISTDAYKKITTNTPLLWGELYKLAKKGPLSDMSEGVGKILSRKIYKLFEEFNPDIVVSCHPLGSQMTAYLKKHGKTNTKLATIMTDYAPHEQWLIGHTYNDYFFVSHEGMKQNLIEQGVDANKVFATGIPLSNKFLQHYDKKQIQLSFDLNPDRRTILFFGGGEFGLGKSKTVKLLEYFIDNIGDVYQIVAIAGKNEKMQNAFQEVVNKKSANEYVQVYGFSNEIPELMSVSDVVVTKPGGLTITESLASGLPIIIINPIPGQEVENSEFLTSKGVAVWIKNDDNPEEKIANLLSDFDQLHEMKVRSKLLAKKHSTKNICEIILKD